MKTLQAFWHWVENEKPAAITTYAARQKTCTEVEMQAVDIALDAVKERNGGQPWNDRSWNEFVGPLRDLSLEICRALEKMNEAVPAAEKPLMWNDDKLHALAVADQPMLSAWLDVNEKAAKALEAQMDAGMNSFADRGMRLASMAALYESYRIEPIEIQLCSPCRELGCYSTTTLDMLCADCQVKCGLEPKLKPPGGIGVCIYGTEEAFREIALDEQARLRSPSYVVHRLVRNKQDADSLRGFRLDFALKHVSLCQVPIEVRAYLEGEVLAPILKRER